MILWYTLQGVSIVLLVLMFVMAKQRQAKVAALEARMDLIEEALRRVGADL